MPHQTETSHEPGISSPIHVHRFNQAGGVDHPPVFGRAVKERRDLHSVIAKMVHRKI